MNAIRIWAVGAALAVGALISDLTRVSSIFALTVAGLGLVSVAAVWWVHREREPGSGEHLPQLGFASVCFLLIGFVSIGLANHAVRRLAVTSSDVSRLDGRVVALEGRVTSEPRRLGGDRVFTIRTQRVGARPGDGVVEIAARTAPEVGDHVRGIVKLRRLDLDGHSDPVRMRKGIAMRGRVIGSLEVVSHSRDPLMTVANHLRRRMEQSAITTLDPPDAGLLLGMTIGDEELIGESTVEAFRTSGLSHLTAVSGANVAIVIGAIILALRVLRRSRRAQIGAALGALVLFVLVTRWEPSVLRASVTTGIALCAFFFGRRPIGMHSLGAAFFILMLANPNILWSVGAQLSFAATAAILLGGRPLADKMMSTWRVPKPLAEASALAMAAQAGVWPLIAVHFETVSVWSVPANIFAFPLVAPITILGFTTAVAGSIWVPAGAASAWLAGPPIDLLSAIARRFASLPGAQIQIHRAGWMVFVLACLITGAIAAFVMSRKRTALVILAVTLLVASVTSVVGASAGPPSDAMRVTFFDVGQGDAALVESPGGARILVDGGPDPGLVTSLLSRRGIRRIDLVVFSHAHADHIKGLTEVLRSIAVTEVLHPGTRDLPPKVRRYQHVVEGMVFEAGDLRVEVLSPTPDLIDASAEDAGEGESHAINDASVVLKVLFGDGCVLFTGDIEELAQEDLVQRYGERLACDVMKAPHHGSARLVEKFVDAVDPEVVPVSVGPNRFGHPTRSALRMFARAGGRTLRTDELGDTVVEIGRDGSVAIE